MKIKRKNKEGVEVEVEVAEHRTFAEMETLKVGDKPTADQVLKVLAGIQERVGYLVKRDGGVDPEIQAAMQADLVVAQQQLAEVTKIAKAAGRTETQQFNPMMPLLFAEHIVPEDARATPGYYLLASLTADELRFGAQFRSIGSPMQRVARNYERVADADDQLIEDFKRVNDLLYITDIVMFANGRTAYARRAGNQLDRMKTLKLWKEWERLTKQFERALSTGTAGSGGNWVPTQLSSRLAELIQPQLQVAALFEQVDMPNKTFDYPILGADPVCFLIAEGVSIAGLAGALSEVSTLKTTFTAVKLAGRSIASTEVLEDAAPALESIILRKLAASVSRGIEDACLNGDTAITAGGTGAQDFDLQAAQLAGFATDRRGAWTGLRKHSLISNMPNVDLATFSLGNLLAIRAAMKGGTGGNSFATFASRLAWIVGFTGYIKLLTASEVPGTIQSNFTTIEKYGAGATILNGEIGQLCGSPVILSEFQRDDVASTGLNTMAGPNTKATLQLVSRDGFAMGRRRDITIQRSSEHRFDTDEIEYTGTWRGHFRDLFPTAAAANRSVGLGRNF